MTGLLGSTAAVPGPGPDPPVVMNSTLSLLPISPIVLAGSCKRKVNKNKTKKKKMKYFSIFILFKKKKLSRSFLRQMGIGDQLKCCYLANNFLLLLLFL
jgi:hypothetical protein